jgi:hypothetical protein
MKFFHSEIPSSCNNCCTTDNTCHEPQEKEKEKVGGQQKAKTSSHYSAPFFADSSQIPPTPLNHLTDVQAAYAHLTPE